VWSTHGQFLPIKEARGESLRVASANWLAAAALAGSYAGDGAALFVDVGSTTTDVVELWQGKPVPGAWTDVERLKSGELVYTGVRRTPVCALPGPKIAAELFAATLDVYLTLDLLPEDDGDCNTADGRPATKPCAHVRLARMLGGDGDTVSEQETAALAREAMDRQTEQIGHAVDNIRRRMPEPPQAFVVSGSGSFLARRIVSSFGANVVSLDDRLGPQLSEAACAYAVAVLAAEFGAKPANL
jgi:probable H4MPT-linked C1 transfer pathway protein